MTQLITVPDNKNVLAAANTSGAYLGRVKLCQGDDENVAMNKVERGGNFMFENDGQVVDLGPKFRVLVCEGRAKAIQFGDEIKVSFDPTSEEFQRMAASSGFGSNCMSGPEYLIYLPDINQFALLFCYNKTLQSINDSIYALRGQSAEFSSFFFKGKKNSWFKAQIEGCDGFDIPDLKAVEDRIKAFCLEAESHVEPEKAAETGRER